MRIAWLVFVSAAACGGHGSGGGAVGAGAAIQRAAQQQCSKAYQCMSSFPPDAGFDFSDIFKNSETECVSFFLEQLDPAAVQAGVDAGTILYDAHDADVCLDFTASLTCSEFWAGITQGMGPMTPPECDTSFVGTVETGGTCETNLECVSGSCAESAMTCQ